MKTAVYGTLLGLLNVKNHEVASRLFDDIITATKEALAKSEWQKVKYYVRYFGELVNANVILPAAYLDLLNDLLAAIDESHLIIVSTAVYLDVGFKVDSDLATCFSHMRIVWCILYLQHFPG
jgi:hypothetical protein